MMVSHPHHGTATFIFVRLFHFRVGVEVTEVVDVFASFGSVVRRVLCSSAIDVARRRSPSAFGFPLFWGGRFVSRSEYLIASRHGLANVIRICI